MGGGEKPPANRMSLQQQKARRVGAVKGHQLLKKKRDALKARFQKMLKEILDTKLKAVRGMKECQFSMAKTLWAGGDVSDQVLETAKKPASSVSLSCDNVAGVILPTFTFKHDEVLGSQYDNLGVGQGGQVIETTRITHVKVLKELISLASLQTSFVTLDAAIQSTSRRVNALEYVVIPAIEEIVEYIKSEMDEIEREEFFRIKKVVANKRKMMELAAEAEAQGMAMDDEEADDLAY